MSSPKILRLSEADLADEALVEAAATIARGGIVVHPTETLYGLAVDPWNEDAVKRLASLKNRDIGAGFIVIVDSIEQARALVRSDPSRHWESLAGAFWPGPLTLIVAAANGAPRFAIGPGGIAIRLPADPIARALIRAASTPLTSTSANRRGEPPATTGEESARRFGDAVDLVLDAGLRPGGVPSTILDLAGAEPSVLREGAISRGSIEACLARVRLSAPTGRRRA